MKAVAVITDGVEQTIRLPQGYHLQADEVLVKRVGCSLLLIPKDADRWQMFSQSLDEFTDDFMQDRAQPAQQEREASFE